MSAKSKFLSNDTTTITTTNLMASLPIPHGAPYGVPLGPHPPVVNPLTHPGTTTMMPHAQVPHEVKQGAGTTLFNDTFKEYLSTVSQNIIILAAVTAILVHLFMVLAFQKTFRFSSIEDILEGPVLLVAISGLLGSGFLFSKMGFKDKTIAALYLPFGLLVVGLSIWSVSSDSKAVDDFDFEKLKTPDPSAPESFIWILLVGLVLGIAVMQWRDGQYRLDALSSGTIAPVIFILLAVAFSIGLSKLFALIIKTIDSTTIGATDPDKDSTAYGVLYVLGSLSMILIVSAGIRFLDAIVEVIGGFGTVYKPSGVYGASMAVLETHRAFQLALYTLIFVNAALMWRRRNGVSFGKPVGTEEGRESLVNEWLAVVAFVIVIPMAAVVSEASKQFVRINPALFDLLRTVILSSVLVYVGVGYFPWNFVTLSLVGIVISGFAFRYLELDENYDKPFSAFICVGMYVMGKLAFLEATRQNQEEETKATTTTTEPQEKASGQPTSLLDDIRKQLQAISTTQPWMYVLGPAMLFGVFGILAQGGEDSEYMGKIAQVYASFVLFNTFGMDFYTAPEEVIKPKSLGLQDSPYYQIIPGNEYASLAVEGILLAAVLMSTNAIHGVVIPGGMKLNKCSPAKPLTCLTGMVSFGAIGAATAVAFTTLKYDNGITNFARHAQRQTDIIGFNFIADAHTTEPIQDTVVDWWEELNKIIDSTGVKVVDESKTTINEKEEETKQEQTT